MTFQAIDDVDALQALYGTPGEASLAKVATQITPEYRRLLEASPFFTLASVGPEGLDCSPRGEQGGAFTIHDDRTLIIPDRRGNNRIDTLRNIVRDPRVAFCFLIPGSKTTVRLNGTAIVTADEALLASLERDGQKPRSAIVVTVREIYTQCGRAVMRAGLWDASRHVDPTTIPTPGDVLAAQTKGGIDGKAYDEKWPERAARTMW
ncbi:MAG: pyridoxamine 5'-phosphate oxidase family protein [Phyllobacteriaceae bacterium]|jgi:PPOX class probable FMN-dependent enzyme|nr:pyridoxamine 5'-phosphate oxidase family protein [Phyllobacteriaceae bacterium]